MDLPNGQSDAGHPSKEYAPQDTYRSYDKPSVYDGGPMYNTEFTKHERVSHEDMIVRANGGVTNPDSMTDSDGNFQSDGK